MPFGGFRAIFFAVLACFLPASAWAEGEGPPSVVVLDRVLQFWDTDSNGEISRDELIGLRMKIHKGFDTNYDGVWDAEEYERYNLGLEKHREKMPLKLREQTLPLKRTLEWEFNDRNRDGIITDVEFGQGADFWFDFLDANFDGKISKDDRAPLLLSKAG
jgi:hypothetical protein